MKILAGVYVNDGDVFNALAESDVELQKADPTGDDNIVWTVGILDLVNVLAAAIGKLADDIAGAKIPPTGDLDGGAEWARTTLCDLSGKLSDAILSHKSTEAQTE